MDTQSLSRNPETQRRNGETPAPPPAPPLAALSLKDLHEALGARGVTIGYSALSELIASGDVATLLGAGGTGGRRAFPPSALETLAGFLPGFQSNGGRRPQAPVLLRAHLLHGGQAVASAPDTGTDLAELRNPETGVETQKPGGGLAAILAPLASLAGLPAVLRELAGAIREMRAGRDAPQAAREVAPEVAPQDRLLSAEEAAARLACSPRAVSRYVPAVLPRKWRESDILAYIAGLSAR